MNAQQRVSIVLIASVLSLAGCVSVPTFTTGYEPTPAIANQAAVSGGLVVHSFEDRRGARKAGSSGDLFLLYIPLLPFIRSDFERFEETVREESLELQLAGSRGPWELGTMELAPSFAQYSYPRSMARAVAKDFRQSGLFDNVFYVEPGDAAPDHRYELRGVLHETTLHRHYSAYGLGIPGVMLWLLPVPYARISAEVQLDLRLVDVSAGETKWMYSVTGKIGRIVTPYHEMLAYGPNGRQSLELPIVGDDHGVETDSIFAWHFAALRRGMAEAKTEFSRLVDLR